MNTKVGNCPKCDAPIYVPLVWHSIFPLNLVPVGILPTNNTCGCDEHLKR